MSFLRTFTLLEMLPNNTIDNDTIDINVSFKGLIYSQSMSLKSIVDSTKPNEGIIFEGSYAIDEKYYELFVSYSDIKLAFLLFPNVKSLTLQPSNVHEMTPDEIAKANINFPGNLQRAKEKSLKDPVFLDLKEKFSAADAKQTTSATANASAAKYKSSNLSVLLGDKKSETTIEQKNIPRAMKEKLFALTQMHLKWSHYHSSQNALYMTRLDRQGARDLRMIIAKRSQHTVMPVNFYENEKNAFLLLDAKKVDNFHLSADTQTYLKYSPPKRRKQ